MKKPTMATAIRTAPNRKPISTLPPPPLLSTSTAMTLSRLVSGKRVPPRKGSLAALANDSIAIHGGGEIDVLLRDAAGIVSRQCHVHLVVDIEPFGMVIQLRRQ